MSVIDLFITKEQQSDFDDACDYNTHNKSGRVIFKTNILKMAALVIGLDYTKMTMDNKILFRSICTDRAMGLEHIKDDMLLDLLANDLHKYIDNRPRSKK